MPIHKPYRDAREEMFANYPPDVYYGDCPPKTGVPASLSKQYLKLYKQIYFGKNPTCIFIKNTIVPAISKNRLRTLTEMGYTL